MNARVMSPVPQGPEEQPYQYQAWPAWMYGPEGRSAVFDRAEDVPDGWVSHDDYLAGALDEAEETGITGAEQTRKLTDDQRKNAVGKLVDGNTQQQLVDMLLKMQEIDGTIEFLPGWPKGKLADTIVDNGGPLEDEAK